METYYLNLSYLNLLLTCKYSTPGVDTLYDGLYVDAAERSTTYVPLSCMSYTGYF